MLYGFLFRKSIRKTNRFANSVCTRILETLHKFVMKKNYLCISRTYTYLYLYTRTEWSGLVTLFITAYCKWIFILSVKKNECC